MIDKNRAPRHSVVFLRDSPATIDDFIDLLASHDFELLQSSSTPLHLRSANSAKSSLQKAVFYTGNRMFIELALETGGPPWEMDFVASAEPGPVLSDNEIPLIREVGFSSEDPAILDLAMEFIQRGNENLSPIERRKPRRMLGTKGGSRIQRVICMNWGAGPALVEAFTLARAGFEVFAVTRLSDGLKLLGMRQPDLGLLDIMIADGTGFQVLDSLKTSFDLRHVPIIIVSADDRTEVVTRCHQMGADDFLSIPFDGAELLKRVDNVIGKSRKRRSGVPIQ